MKRNHRILGTMMIAAMTFALASCGSTGDKGGSSSETPKDSELQVDATNEDMEYETTTTVTAVTTTTTTTTEVSSETTTTTETTASGNGGGSSGNTDLSRPRDDSTEVDYEAKNVDTKMSGFAISNDWYDMSLAAHDMTVKGITEHYGLVPIEGDKAAYSGVFTDYGFSGSGYYTFTYELTGETDTKSTKMYMMTNEAGEVVGVDFKDFKYANAIIGVGEPDAAQVYFRKVMNASDLTFVFRNSKTYEIHTEDDVAFLAFNDGTFSTLFVLGNQEDIDYDQVSEVLVINNKYLNNVY